MLPDVVDHLALVFKRLQILQDSLAALLLLLGKCKSTCSSTGETSVETESSDSSTSVGVSQEFEVVEGTVSSSESAENITPASLLLVAVSKGDVGVSERLAVVVMSVSSSCKQLYHMMHSLGLFELLQSVNGNVKGSLVPLVVGDHLAANTIVEDLISCLTFIT